MLIMNNITIFENSKFGRVRSVMIGGNPYFIGKDVAEALGYKNTRDALKMHVDELDKADVAIHDGSQSRINEAKLKRM